MKELTEQLQTQFADTIQHCEQKATGITLEISASALRDVCQQLRDDSRFYFDVLIDLCGVDYSEYGVMQWQTDSATTTGFSRGVQTVREQEWQKPRFAVVYHLLSTVLNQRLRLRVFCETEPLVLESVTDIWASADWYEREAFDLFGISFQGHPDLRRILTDYGFIGHPFRKDFPLSGHVEMRYDAETKRVVYEAVEIEERVLVPKVKRVDNRYSKEAD